LAIYRPFPPDEVAVPSVNGFSVQRASRSGSQRVDPDIVTGEAVAEKVDLP
jgi:hypothetical protein